MKILMKENCGNLGSLKELGKIKSSDFTTEQLLDEKLKNLEGENRIEVTERMNQSFVQVLAQNKGKRIAIVSHGASIKFLLMKWCDLNINNKLEFNGNIISLNSPGVLKLTFEGEKLTQLVQIV